ncbi:MAG: DUF975 family protein [Clostridia bacterium]|nr:DUF975 family protein [Clostridia bacterium]
MASSTSNHQYFKARAKETMRSFGSDLYVAALIVIGVAMLLDKLGSGFKITFENVQHMDFNDMRHLFDSLWNKVTGGIGAATAGILMVWGILFSLAVSCVSVLLEYGLIDYTLRVHRGEIGHPQNVLIGFNTPFRVLGAHLLCQVLTWLGVLCLFFPAFIVAYSLRMTERLLIDHPEWSVWTCMKESRRMMRGHKFDLFCLDLSFIGWGLLEGFFKPIAIYSMPFRYLAVHGFYEALERPAQKEEAAPTYTDGGFEEDSNVW